MFAWWPLVIKCPQFRKRQQQPSSTLSCAMCLLPMWSAYVDWALRSVYLQSCFQPPSRSHSGSPPISNRWCSCGGQVAHRGWIGKVDEELLFSKIGSTTFRIECQVWMQSVCKHFHRLQMEGEVENVWWIPLTWSMTLTKKWGTELIMFSTIIWYVLQRQKCSKDYSKWP